MFDEVQRAQQDAPGLNLGICEPHVDLKRVLVELIATAPPATNLAL